MYGLSLTSAPAIEPLTLEDAKRQLRLSSEVSAHDELITSLIKAARQYCEQHTGRQFINATWALKLDRFPVSEPIRIPKAPLSSITSITYLDSSGDSQTWGTSNYRVSTSKEPGEVSLAYGQSYPSTYPVADAVTVTFVAGYGSAATSVPEPLRQAMLMYVEKLFDGDPTKAKSLDMAINALLLMYRCPDEFTTYAESC